MKRSCLKSTTHLPLESGPALPGAAVSHSRVVVRPLAIESAFSRVTASVPPVLIVASPSMAPGNMYLAASWPANFSPDLVAEGVKVCRRERRASLGVAHTLCRGTARNALSRGATVGVQFRLLRERDVNALLHTALPCALLLALLLALFQTRTTLLGVLDLTSTVFLPTLKSLLSRSGPQECNRVDPQQPRERSCQTSTRRMAEKADSPEQSLPMSLNATTMFASVISLRARGAA